MTLLNTKYTTLLVLLACSAFAQARADSAENKASRESTSSTIAQDGVQFELINSTHASGVQTEEYFVKGETPKSWSQTLTFQKIDLPAATSVDLFLEGFRKKLERGSAGFRLVQESKNSAIFGVQYPADGDNVAEVVLVFVCKLNAKKPNELQVTQYAVNPAKMQMDQMEAQMKRWQGRFQSQAASLK